MTNVVCVLKTNEGGLWAVPQVEELRSRGHKVTVVIPGGPGKLRRILDGQSIPVVESAFDFDFRPSVRLIRGLLGLRRQLRELKADTVFYHLYASALAVRLSTLFMQVRRVHMVAGPLYLESTPIRTIERFLCRLDDIVIGGSEHTAARYRAIRMPPSRVRAMPYGVDVRHFVPGRVAPESAHPSMFTVIMVAYVYAPKSSVHPGVGIKGHEIVLEAWRRFVSECPNSRLILVGAGFDERGETHRNELKRQWASTLGASVIWIESVSDVRGWYASADISISPSLSENHGAALEASASGCPSIVSDAGALPEAVANGKSGWVVPAGDVASTVDALRGACVAWKLGQLTEMGKRARALVELKFDSAECARRVADIVETA